VSQSKIEIGNPAPPFSLLDQEEKTVSPADFAGSWVILYFYPRDDTPGCTTEACEFTEEIREFERLGAVVLGCSPDRPEQHRRFIAKHRLSVRLLSDPDHRVMDAYGAWGEKSMYGRTTTGVIRSTVILDPEGRIAHLWKRVTVKGHAAKVWKKLSELQG
jgi:peroxiredoxin Q/BCP